MKEEEEEECKKKEEEEEKKEKKKKKKEKETKKTGGRARPESFQSLLYVLPPVSGGFQLPCSLLTYCFRIGINAVQCRVM